MANRILIPTPLRPFTDKQDAVDAAGATVGELLADLTTQARRSEGAPLQRAGQAAQLRQHLRQRRGHPLSAEGADAGEAGRHAQHHPVGRRRRADATGDASADAADADQRRDQALQPAPDHAGGRRRRAAEAEGRRACCASARAASARRRRCISPRPASARIGIVDFDVVDFSNLQRQILHGTPDVGRSKLASAKDRLNAINPHVAGRDLRDGAVVGERAASCSSRTTSSSTAPTTSRRATS